MKIYDVTVTLRGGLPVYPGDKPFERKVTNSIADGGSSNYSILTLGAHTGTHVDAPLHMIDGAASADELDVAALVGSVDVIEVKTESAITPQHLKDHDWPTTERVLFKTSNSGLLEGESRFKKDYVHLSGEAAEFLARQKVKLVGVDYLSVDRFHSGTHAAHVALVRAGIVIIEGLDLSGVPAGRYELFCGPLKVAGGDGAPARVFLIDRSK